MSATPSGRTRSLGVAVAIAVLVLGVAGFVAAFGLARNTTWGIPAALAVAGANVVGAVIALLADSEGATDRPRRQCPGARCWRSRRAQRDARCPSPETPPVNSNHISATARPLRTTPTTPPRPAAHRLSHCFTWREGRNLLAVIAPMPMLAKGAQRIGSSEGEEP